MSEAKKEKKRGTGNFFSLPRRFYARKFFSLRKKTCATSPCRAVQITGNTVTYNAALATQHQRLESPCPVVCRLFRVTLPPPLFKNMQQETGLAVRSSTPFNRMYGRAMKKKKFIYRCQRMVKNYTRRGSGFQFVPLSISSFACPLSPMNILKRTPETSIRCLRNSPRSALNVSTI